MIDQIPEANGFLPADVETDVEGDLPSSALKEFDGIGIREILDQDSRPTFVIDLDPDLHLAVNTGVLSLLFSNAPLRSYESLWDVVRGVAAHGDEPASSAYDEFRGWVTSRTKFDESGDVFPSTHVFFGMLWTGSTVRKRWRLISGYHYDQLHSGAPRDLSSGPPAEMVLDSYKNALEQQHRKRRQQPHAPQRPPNTVLPSTTESQDPHVSSRRESTVISSVRPRTRVTSEHHEHESSYSSVGGKSATSINLDIQHYFAPDWTATKPRGMLNAHQEFARSIDWASTPLGDMQTWTPELRQIANLVMKHPHSCALFYGDELTCLYNEAYRDTVAGRKHPALMGTGFRGPFAETWTALAGLFIHCAQTGEPIAMENQMIPIERHGILEETFYTWSFTPLYGSGKKVLGFFNTPFETTKQQINDRRTQTLRRLGEETSAARTVVDFWQALLRGLEVNHYDVPVAILYSVADTDDGDVSSHSGSSISLKSCNLEGSLGIPEGHVAAPDRLDLKRSTEGFVPSFREAMRTREPTKIQTRDGTLPESLIEGIQWRGFEEPCREAIIFPVRPTNAEAVMAFLLIGVNPRRPYDEDYHHFVNILNRQLSTSLASIMLYEDEIRRGQTAAEAAAKEREQLSDQLAMQTLRLQRMTETSPVGMYYIDEKGVMLEANDRYYEITGHPRDDRSELSFRHLFHEESLQIALDSWLEYTVHRRPWTGELRLKKPWIDPTTGEVLENWILGAGQPEYYADGSFKLVLGSITDISRIKWAEGLQNRRLQDAEETRRQTNNFLDLTSHEMRNPLSAMIHCADEIQAVLKEVQLSSPTSTNVPTQTIVECIEAAETITLCAQHQKSIVDDILTVSKLDSDLLVISPSPVQPVAIARQAVKMFDAELQKKDVQCDYIVDASFETLHIEWALLDRSRIVQVLINLLTNAIKFTQDRATRKITVRVGASLTPAVPPQGAFDFEYIAPKNGEAVVPDSEEWGSGEPLYLQFQVQDTGRGLTKEEKTRLFMRFSQATPRTHAQYGGSGLGLFISRQLTELHGGQIGVGSEAGVGSTFAFYVLCRRAVPQHGATDSFEQAENVKPGITKLRHTLPLRTANSTAPLTPAVTPPPTGIDYKQLHVLIVEDNLVNQKVLSKQLKKIGCSVEVADHGGIALAYLEKTQFWQGRLEDGNKLSIILLDMEMPVMDGLTCIKTIRELERRGTITSHIPVIAVTANVRSELVAMAKQSGMDDVVSKPFRIPELLAKIGEVLGA